MRLRLTARHLALLCAVEAIPEYRRLVVERTPLWPAGTRVWDGHESLLVESVLGSGMLGVVYRVSDSQGRAYALKRPRAEFPCFLQNFRAERWVSDRLREEGKLAATPVLRDTPLGLLKPIQEGLTLRQLLLRDQVTPEQRTAFLEVLGQAGRFFERTGVVLDLSPKNVIWSDGWTLMDTGAKLRHNAVSPLLECPDWEGYLAAVADKLQGAEASAPSVLAQSTPVGMSPHCAERYAFLRQWWCWLPLPKVSLDGFLVQLDPEISEDEILWTRDAAGMHEGADADPVLLANPLVTACAIRVWIQQFGDLWATDRQTPDLQGARDPISLPALASLVADRGYGSALRLAVADREALPLPTLKVRSYEHWSHLARKGQAVEPFDIFCQEPLVEISAEVPSGGFFASAGPWPDGRFSQVLGVPHGDTSHAIILIPGFRGDHWCALPLATALGQAGVEGLFLLSYLGYRNAHGQALVTGGRWETAIVWDIVDYAVTCCGAKRVSIVAASHGVMGAILAARLHPAVSTLVLDSAFRRPFKLLQYLAREHGIDTNSLRGTLQKVGMPDDYELPFPRRAGLDVFSLRPFEDRFLTICGHLGDDDSHHYSGRHAASMRYDTFREGIPADCLDFIVSKLGKGTHTCLSSTKPSPASESAPPPLTHA